MKNFFKILLIVLFFSAPVANAGTILATGQGGTGTSTFQSSSIPFFSYSRFAEDNTNFSYSSSTGHRLTVTNASTTNLSASVFCIIGDVCRTSWPGAGSGAWPFTTTDSNFGVPVQSTSTPEWFKTGVFASSTSQIVYASTTQLSVTSLCLNEDVCRTTWPSGVGGAASWPFTTGNTNYGVLTQSTTTPEWFQNGLMASTTAYFVNASTTQLTVGGTTWLTGLTGPNSLAIDSTGKLYATATTTASSPLTYSAGSFSIQNATASQAGAETQNEFNFVHAATSTFSAPLSWSAGTNAVTCTAATGSVNGCLSSTDWSTFASKSGWPFTPNFSYNQSDSSTSTLIKLTGSPFSLVASSTVNFVNASTTQFTVFAGGNVWFANLTGPAPLAIDSTGRLYAAATTSAANPSANVGSASATNGTASTYMRSDASPACTTATASVPGCLAAADFTIFAAKQSALTFTTPLILNGTTVAFSGISTSTALTGGGVLAARDASSVYTQATSSETCTAPILCSAYTVLAGGGAISFTGTLALASGGTNASLSGANQVLFMNAANTAVSASSSMVFTGYNAFGIATSSPWATLSVIGDLTRPLFAIATSTTGNASSTETIFMIDQNFHKITGGGLPVVTLCGTNATVIGNDSTMKITTGSTGTTGCTITFSKTWAPYPAPICSFDEQGSTATVTVIGSTTQTTLKIGLSASLTSATIAVICQTYFQ